MGSFRTVIILGTTLEITDTDKYNRLGKRLVLVWH